MGLKTLYINATNITDTTELTKVVTVLSFANIEAASCGCPKIYCL